MKLEVSFEMNLRCSFSELKGHIISLVRQNLVILLYSKGPHDPKTFFLIYIQYKC